MIELAVFERSVFENKVEAFYNSHLKDSGLSLDEFWKQFSKGEFRLKSNNEILRDEYRFPILKEDGEPIYINKSRITFFASVVIKNIN